MNLSTEEKLKEAKELLYQAELNVHFCERNIDYWKNYNAKEHPETPDEFSVYEKEDYIQLIEQRKKHFQLQVQLFKDLIGYYEKLV